MKEIALYILKREPCHQFFREYESDSAVYADERQFQLCAYREDIASSFYERKQVPGRLESAAMMDGRTIGHVQPKASMKKNGNVNLAATCKMIPSKAWGTVHRLLGRRWNML